MSRPDDAHILEDVVQRITAEFGFKGNGDWLQKGLCPSCGKKELFTRKSAPWVLRCGRADNCGNEVSVRKHYPEIFDTWSNRFKATETDPNAAADAYLYHNRGLNLLNMRGCYSQETYADRDRRLTTATVRFPLPNDTWWERLIDQPGRFDKKARFKYGGSHAGHVWHAPDQPIEVLARANDIWLAEGIFDAWALRDPNPGAGLHAVSLMSCNNWPEHFLARLRQEVERQNLKKRPRLVFALDIGRAGTEYTRKFVAKAIDEGWLATAAQPRPEGETDKADWNDLKLAGKLTPDDIKGYLWNGRVLLAETATDKALLLHEKHEWTSFPFVHKARTYWASFNTARMEEMMSKDGITPKAAARHCVEVNQIGNCAFQVLYFQYDKLTDEGQWFLQLNFPRDNSNTKATFSGSMLSAAGEFKKRLMSVSPGQWTGSTFQLDRIMARQIEVAKKIEALGFTGYSREHQAWVLGDYAVHKGRVVNVNAEDYYDLGGVQLKIKSQQKMLSHKYDPDQLDTSWLDVVFTAWRGNGLVTVVFWVMAFFAEQIRAEYASLGYLEMHGKANTGKSTIILFLWKLAGLINDSYEGIDPSKSTMVGYIRTLSRVANLPVVFVESDRSETTPHAKRFDWSEIKGLFNGQIGRATGVKSGGNETYEPPFRGALIIEQNNPVNSEEPVLSRIMSTEWTKEGWSPATKSAAEKIEQWPRDSVSGVMIHIIKREADYMAAFRAGFTKWEADLGKQKIRHARVRKCHAQLHAGLDALAAVMKIPDSMLFETHEHINGLAAARDRSMESDHPMVANFWEMFDLLESREDPTANLEDLKKKPPVNLHRSPAEKIAINLFQFEAACRNSGNTCPPLDDLKKHLKSSKSRPFVEATTVNTVIEKHLHCWVFLRSPANKKGN
ncbi:hypothetical protein ABAC460_10080 [Asticcacaulis sp. AC460]|uniref:toprim domain-containing protein n=1 Tax=Asticcacaulis sp. AC460 TaxID=1282360 RepID=UPI0003C3C661|nr:toprim domain-containing protein [Asticcacaulis sp. AC460]ESQ90105.1 hypothetical protein ABAC460_10080 [Asticcacaulis sp. AC460]